MKKVLFGISLGAVLLLLLFSISGCSGKYLYDFSIAPLCVHSPAPGISVERETKINAYKQLNGAINAEISETFMLHNSGEETTIILIYPSLIDYSDKIEFSINGERSKDWWGAGQFNELRDDLYYGTLVDKLNNGTYFNRAFPNWPELGDQIHQMDSRPEDKVINNVCSIAYFAKKVIIPANETITVTANFVGESASTVSILRLAEEIPCTKHTISVSVDRENDVTIEEQNLIENVPDSSTWTTTLDPTCEDYYIRFVG